MQHPAPTQDVGRPFKVVVERPRGGIPVCLIVDDPAPCINTLYYYRLQVDGANYKQHESKIPFDFLEQFVDVCTTRGIRGKFSILPYPAGLGSILQGWEGCDYDEIVRWLDLVKTKLVRDWDITPEILTHTLALDLQSRTMFAQSEQGWMAERTRDELTTYMSAATAILRKAGFVSNGITQPVEFKGDFVDYAHATLVAVQSVGGPDVTFCYLNEDLSGPPYKVSGLLLLDRERGHAVVNIETNCPEHFWATQQPENRQAEDVADRFITADGSSGRLIDMIAHDAWLVMVCHWQSLYSDGSRAGLLGLDMVTERLAQQYGTQIQWLTTGEIARYRAATEGCTITTRQEANCIEIELDAAIPCPDFTLSFPFPLGSSPSSWNVTWQPSDGSIIKLSQYEQEALLLPGTWRQDGKSILLCFALQRGRQRLHLYLA